MEKNNNKLCFNSSEIAKITGYNKYIKRKEFIEIFEKYLYKNRNDLIKLDDINIISEKDNIKNLLTNLNDSDNKKINKLINIEYNNNKTLLDNSKKISKIINNSDISSTEKKNIKKVLNNTINCLYGSNTESKSIELYEQENNCKILENNTKCYTKDYKYFIICGKIDGLIKKDNKIFINEIKNRKNRIFQSIPIYEKIQLLCYTKLLNNNNIIFTQFKDDIYDTIILENYVDDELWKNIIYKLKKYCYIVYKLRLDTKLRKEYLDTKNKYKFLKKYLD